MGGGTRDNRHYDEASLYGRHDCWIRWRGKNTITVRSACRKGRLKSEESMRMTKGEDETTETNRGTREWSVAPKTLE